MLNVNITWKALQLFKNPVDILLKKCMNINNDADGLLKITE
jgi:hypothetical protein